MDFGPIWAATRRSCGAAVVWVCLIEPSCRPRWWLDVADGGDDLPKYVARYSHLRQLERDFAGMAHNSRPDFDQAALDACE